jgi:predicted nucleic acid-binding protein
MTTLVDTNLLTRIVQPAHVQHQDALDAVTALRLRGEALHLVPQNFFEFWVVATRPAAQNGLGMSAAEAAVEFATFRRLFTVLDDTPAILPEWEQLVSRLGVVGKTAHDARLVASMRVHGLNRLLTFNVGDFRRYPGLTVVSPSDVLSAAP